MSTEVDQWIKEKISPLFELIRPISNDGMNTSVGDVWSLKKEVALHLYIPSYFNIIKEYFKKWYYFDPFCGNGLINFDNHPVLKNVKFPGSPVVSLSHKSKYPFHDYFLSDKDSNVKPVLEKRLTTLYGSSPAVGIQSFANAISSVEQIDAQTGAESCLAVIDPVGYSAIPWTNMQRLFRIKTCDLFIVVMTRDLQRNLVAAKNSRSQQDKGLTDFLGDGSWKGCDSGDDIVDVYRERISAYGKFTELIRVNRVGEVPIYDIILATRSKGGLSAMRGITSKLQEITTEQISKQAVTGSGTIEAIDRFFPDANSED